MFFHPKNLKSENNNPWFKPWFNILLHTQSILCATVDSQCLEYLGCITLAPGCHPPQEKWKVTATWNFERNFQKSGHPDKLAQPFEKVSEHLPRACPKTEKWTKTKWLVCSLHQLEKQSHSGIVNVTDRNTKSVVACCLFR